MVSCLSTPAACCTPLIGKLSRSAFNITFRPWGGLSCRPIIRRAIRRTCPSFFQGGAEVELLGRVADTSRYADVNVFWDATPAVRLGLSGQYTQVEYLRVG